LFTPLVGLLSKPIENFNGCVVSAAAILCSTLYCIVVYSNSRMWRAAYRKRLLLGH